MTQEPENCVLSFAEAMTTRKASNAEDDPELSPTHSANSSSTMNSTIRSISSTNNNNNNIANNWFRSIPKRFRKFISKHRHFSFSHPQNASNYVNGTAADPSASHPSVDGDVSEDINFYSNVEQLVNDEEVAMIRACSQMTRQVALDSLC